MTESRQRCLVTGAAGFVGSTLCDRLLADGHEVVGLDCFVDYYPREVKLRNLSLARSHPKFSFIEGDLSTLSLAPIVADIEWVFHQAAQAGVRASWGSSFEIYTRNNIFGTQRLLEALKVSPALKKLVYASSSSVYGDAETLPTPESTLPRPMSPYGVSKLAAEHLMGLYAREFFVPTVSLRYFTVFGPRQRPDMAFNRFIRAALGGEELTVFGDGEQSRDFTYIDDIVEANIQAAARGVAGDVLNIGGGEQATVNQVLRIIEAEVGNLKVNYRSREFGDARHTSADTARAREQLKFTPRTSLADGIRQEIRWMQTVLAERNNE